MRTLLLITLLASVTSAGAQSTTRPIGAIIASGDSVRVAELLSGAPRPRFPDMLRSAGVEGEVRALFVIDTMGRVDMSTFMVLKSTHDLFTNAVRAAVGAFRYVPAMRGEKKVAQSVDTLFLFTLPRR
jgi:TonB family protein